MRQYDYLPGMEYDLHLAPPDIPRGRLWRVIARFIPKWDAVFKATIRLACGAALLFTSSIVSGWAAKGSAFAGQVFVMLALWGLITPAEAVFVEHVQEVVRRIAKRARGAA